MLKPARIAAMGGGRGLLTENRKRQNITASDQRTCSVVHWKKTNMSISVFNNFMYIMFKNDETNFDVFRRASFANVPI